MNDKPENKTIVIDVLPGTPLETQEERDAYAAKILEQVRERAGDGVANSEELAAAVRAISGAVGAPKEMIAVGTDSLIRFLRVAVGKIEIHGRALHSTARLCEMLEHSQVEAGYWYGFASGEIIGAKTLLESAIDSLERGLKVVKRELPPEPETVKN